MNRFNKFLAATFLSAMLLPGVVQAMEIRQFDKMAAQDRSAYVADLIVGAQKVLIDEGRSDLAAQVQNLFTETLPGNESPLGMVEFASNLDLLRVADTENAQKNPKDPRVEVEDAMALTLQKNHIDLPDSFFSVNSGFQPKHTPPAKDSKDNKN